MSDAQFAQQRHAYAASMTWSKSRYDGSDGFAFIIVVCVVLAVLVHAGVLDKTTAWMVAAFFPVLWNAIKNAVK